MMSTGMLLWLVASAQGVAAEEYGPCAGKWLNGPAIDVLRGAHLKVLQLEWAPFAYKDTAASHGWSGFDIDLFQEVAHILGFSFEITEAPSMNTNETYTQFLIRTVGKSQP
jgi:ABC-type amino acid transport substrate-binding protein